MKPVNKSSLDRHSYSTGMNGSGGDQRPNIRKCPSCGEMSLSGMPGGRDAFCKNCGFKEPCCGD